MKHEIFIGNGARLTPMIYTHTVSDDIPRSAWMIYKAFALMIYTPLA